MNYFIPLIAGILYRTGGTDQWKWCPLKQTWWRSFIGIPIGFTYAIIDGSWFPLLCILTYLFQPPYGENSYLNFLGENGKFTFCGFIFGLSALPRFIGAGLLWVGILQAVISAIAFLVIKVLDDKNVVKNPWVEVLRGFAGTVMYIFK